MANRFWTGTGTWDNVSTANWGTATGGTGASPPAATDSVIFDANSVSCTVAATINGSNTITTMVASTSTGIIDFSVNNPILTVQSFVANGASAPIVKLGTGALTVTGANGFDLTNVNASSTTSSGVIVMSPGTLTGNSQNFAGAGRTYSSVTFNNRTTGLISSITGANTFGTLIFNGPIKATLTLSTTNTVTSSLQFNGTSSGLAELEVSANSTAIATIAASGATIIANYAALRQLTITGSPAWSGSGVFDVGANTGVIASVPAGGGGAIIGS